MPHRKISRTEGFLALHLARPRHSSGALPSLPPSMHPPARPTPSPSTPPGLLLSISTSRSVRFGVLLTIVRLQRQHLFSKTAHEEKEHDDLSVLGINVLLESSVAPCRRDIPTSPKDRASHLASMGITPDSSSAIVIPWSQVRLQSLSSTW